MITVLHREIVKMKIHVQVREHETLSDHLPYDTSLLITVEVDNGVVDLDLTTSPLGGSFEQWRC
jgi:hypothetical protein